MVRCPHTFGDIVYILKWSMYHNNECQLHLALYICSPHETLVQTLTIFTWKFCLWLVWDSDWESTLSHKFWFSRVSSIPGVNWEVSLSDSTSALFHSTNICRLNIYFYQKLTKSLCGKDSSESKLLESDQSHLQCSGVEQVSGASTILINRRVVGLFASKTTTAHETALWYKTQLSV